jgi:hypothetical protein
MLAAFDFLKINHQRCGAKSNCQEASRAKESEFSSEETAVIPAEQIRVFTIGEKLISKERRGARGKKFR